MSSDDPKNKDDHFDGFEEIDLDAELDAFIEDSNNEEDRSSQSLKDSGDEDDFLADSAVSNSVIVDEKHYAGVLAYGGKRYAVGLTWLTVDEDISAELIKERTKRLKADFHCTRNTIVAQHGFGYIDKGHKVGMNAAAALAADALIGEWNGVFVAENGWWYLAVHSDTVEPDGDVFFEKEEDAYNYFLEANNAYQWPRSYAPESWNLPKTGGEIELDKLFDDMPSVPLKPANLNALFGGKRNKEFVMVLGALFLGIMIFTVVVQKTLPGLIPQPKEAPGINITAPDSLFAPPRPAVEVVEEKPLITDQIVLPQPSAILDSCLKAFAELTFPFPGWRLDRMRCRNGLAEATWSKTTGSLDTLRPYLRRFPFGVSTSFSGNNSFIATTILKNLSVGQANTRLPEREVAILTLNARFGKIGRLTAQDVLPQMRASNNTRASQRSENTASNSSNAPNSIDEMPHLKVGLKMASPPNLIVDYFDIPGFIFDMIEWNITNQSWTYDGRVILKFEQQRVSSTQQQNRQRR
jgi:hypothetical protein